MEIVGIGSSGLKRCGGAGEDELVGIELEIDDLLDFSNEEIGGPINGMGIGIGIGICGSANSSAEAVSSEEYPGLSGGLSLWDSAQPSNLSLPCDETAELEWLSNFVHESFSPAPPLLLAPNNGTLLRNSKSDAPVSLLLNPKSDGDCDEARQVDEMKGRELGHAFFNPRSGGDDEARHGIKGRESSSSSSSSNSRVESGSPVSVLENNGSSSYCSTSDGDGHGHSKANTNKRSLLIVPGRPRSKRPRKRAGKWMSSRIHLARGDIEDDSNSIPLLDCSSTSVMAADSAFLLHPLHQHQSQISGPNPFNYHHSPPKTQENKLQKPPALVVKKVKPKPKLLPLPLPSPLPIQKAKSASGDEDMQSRKCLHCGSQKTPQWRAGPLGPKTLCNACGVRFKSGRLFPEYRPAASPSFVEAVHSNSHRKVLEMRRLKESFDPAPPSASAAAAVSFSHPPLLHNNDHDDDDNSDDDDHGRHYITSFS